MHIVLASSYHFSVFRGGNERYADELALGLINQGHQVTYLTGSVHARADYPVITLPFNLFMGKPLPSHAWNHYVPPKTATILHACGSGLPLLSLAHSLKGRLKTVLTFQGPSYPDSLLMRLAVKGEAQLIPRCFCHLITTSPKNLDYCHRIWPKLGVSLIPLMVSPQFFTGKNPIHQPGTKLLFVAKLDRHHYYKGLTYLLSALKALPALFCLTVVGDGPLKPFYLDYVERHHLSDRVNFVGEVPDHQLPDIYRSHGLFCFPSVSGSEGFGLSLIEAMAEKVPTLTTEAIGIAPWLSAQNLSTLVPPKDTSALKQAILKLSQNADPAKIDRAYRFARTLNRESMVSQTLALYGSI